MDWLKDKKNQPIVAGIAAVVILGVGALMYFTFFKAPPATPATPPATTGDPMAQPGMDPMAQPGADPMAAGTPPADPNAAAGGAAPAGAQPGTGAGKTETAAVPMEAWRTDPFLPPGYKPPKTGAVKLKQPIRDLPMFKIPLPPPPPPPEDIPPLAQPVRRMAGLILGDKVYAIVETGGKNQVVQPGDMLEDRLAMVDRIEKDRVILRTVDKKPRYLVVRMSQGVRTETAATPSGPSNRYPRPGGPRPPGGMPEAPGEIPPM